jgi:hypothetical protein
MPGQSASRHAVDPDDLLQAFDSEERDPAFDPKEQDVAVEWKEPGIAVDRNEPDIQPHAPVPPVHGLSVTRFVMHEAVPVVPQSRRWTIGIALLVLGSIGLVWSGLLLMGTPGDAGASAAPAQIPSPPTLDVPQAAPTLSPPGPTPRPPARTDATSATATPSADTAATAATAPTDERPASQAAPRPVVVDPNTPGGLFAITRPLGAQVFLDDMLVGTTPLFMSRLSPGSHQVRLELTGFKTYSSTIQIEPNERFRLALQLEESAR